MKIPDFLNSRLPLGRRDYFLSGLLLMGFKYNLDRAVAAFGFKQSWHPLRYFQPSLRGEAILDLVQSPDLTLYLTLMALALPFIALGVILTLRRLASAGFPQGLVVLFFLPFLNGLFFLLLSLYPPQDRVAPDPAKSWMRWLPQSGPSSALSAALVAVLLSLALVAVGTLVLSSYGWGLFVGTPFCMGLVASLLYGQHQVRSFRACLGVAWVALAMLGGGLVLCLIEGVLCVLMAAPLGLILSALGAWAGWLIQSRRRPLPGPAMGLMLLLPFLMGFESMHARAPMNRVSTAVEIDATSAEVWENVISFGELLPPSDWVLRTGVAYPVRAELRGRGVGAVRHCIFSTGPFVEPITIWEPGRRLRFTVAEQPSPMHELSWLPIHPPHLDSFLSSRGGQFLLTPLPNGRTRLEGTTWYEHRIWPAPYWQLWSDLLIHKIHERVLNHIQVRSEA